MSHYHFDVPSRSNSGDFVISWSACDVLPLFPSHSAGLH